MSNTAANADFDQDSSVSCIGQGLLSIRQVPDLHRLTGLRSLCLHGNNITRIDGLDGLKNLVELNLSSNAIIGIDPGSLHGLTKLTSLNLASNRLQAVHGLDGLSNLEQLNLAYNYISSIAGLSSLQGPRCKLRHLNLKHNQLHNLQAFSVLVGCMSLRWLQVAGNPVCQLPNYMQALVTVLSQLTQLDSLSSAEALDFPYDVQAAQLYAAMRLQSFEPPAPSPPPPPSPPLVPGHGGTAPPHLGHLVHSSHNMQQPQSQPQPQSRGQTQGLQGQLAQGSGASQAEVLASGTLGRDDTAAPEPPPPAVRQPIASSQPRRQGNGEADGGSGYSGPDGDGRFDLRDTRPPAPRPVDKQRQRPADVAPAPDQRPPPPQPQPTMVKVLLSDAAVQTSEYTPLVRRLQVEAVELRQQLGALTDELEKRNAAEESLRQSLAAAVAAAQEDAHRKVEDGFREASFAVSKALQELESARHSANEAQQRVAAHARAEEEQRQRCAGLERDIARLRDDLQRLNQQLLDQQHSGAAALEDERRRGAAAEAAVREQLAAAQTVAAELPLARAAAAAAEQKVASLEAALQQSSSVTVSLTAQIAQTMADANAQIDVLKTRLAAADQQLAEHQRREVEARAEINTLTTALQAAGTQHQREVEAAARQHEEALRVAVDKERAVSEERGKALAAHQAQQKRSELQEQVAFLKVQLQFALKESDKEQVAAQQLLRSAQAEAAELRAALQSAAAKQREAESLVSDLTAVVQQQKAAIQALQREREALAGRLKACGPEAVEALAAENVNLKRAATERDMYREQMDDARRRWQEAERRLTELQVSSARTAEELAARMRSAEGALAAAKEEAARAEATAEKLRHEVAAQQDIVKIKVAMLDSANDTIASLKAEIADLQVEADEARHAAEEAEAALAREQQQQRDQEDQEDGEKVQMRQEAQASEAAAAAARSALAEAQSRLKDVEGRLRAATEAVAEKDHMIKYVEEEVDRVKGLFDKKEQRLRDERDAARSDAAAAAAAHEAAEGRLVDAVSRSERLAREVEHWRGQLDDAAAQLEVQRRAAAAAAESAAARGAEVQRLTVRVAEVEEEMRQLLEAVERQKASSSLKMRQLASLLQEL